MMDVFISTEGYYWSSALKDIPNVSVLIGSYFFFTAQQSHT